MALSGARLGTHPIHPMLVVIPLGLWVTALVFDVVFAFTGNPMTGRARRLATYHMLLNLGAVGIFAVNWFVRTRVSADSSWPLVLSIVGVIGVGIAG